MRKVFLLFTFLITVFTITGCNRNYSSIIFAFNTNISINLYEGNNKNLEDVKNIIYDCYYLADNYNDRKVINVKYLNDNAYNNKVEVSDDLFEMIKRGKEYYELTNGCINIAIGAASYVWQDMINNKNSNVDSLKEYKDSISINDIILDENNKTVEIKNDKLKIDLGAIAKGYALLKVTNYLTENNIKKYIINAGTSSIALGKSIDNDDFNIHIIDPIDQSKTFMDLELSNSAISTSGDYQDYFEKDGVIYHHILNNNLELNHYYKSVTVVADDACLADALSTALFNMNIEDAKQIVEKACCKAIFYKEDCEIIKLWNE